MPLKAGSGKPELSIERPRMAVNDLRWSTNRLVVDSLPGHGQHMLHRWQWAVNQQLMFASVPALPVLGINALGWWCIKNHPGEG